MVSFRTDSLLIVYLLFPFPRKGPFENGLPRRPTFLSSLAFPLFFLFQKNPEPIVDFKDLNLNLIQVEGMPFIPHSP
jgi:hypothetical protein